VQHQGHGHWEKINCGMNGRCDVEVKGWDKKVRLKRMCATSCSGPISAAGKHCIALHGRTKNLSQADPKKRTL